ncbi:DUF2225 domain-containing protein [Brevibacillus sp. SYSU BS000544]|uniref:DUF2225 domain-containing protein n=1 Tax=Brevibacillus sp. SYSU BS000544 TaxID=3416443 RepID=UPI003CE521D1
MIQQDYFYDKHYECQFCSTPFTSKKVRRNSQSVLKRDSDFCTYYKQQSANPVLYTVQVCPNCGYAFTDQFLPVFSPLTKKRIHDNIFTKWTEKEFGLTRSIPEAIACFKLAGFTAELKNEAHSVKAGLYLRLAWLYRFLENEQEEQRFLRMAAKEYEESYIHSDYVKGDKEMSEARILYLIGELFRRIGEFDKAIRYFGKTIELKDRTVEQGTIQMARDQWQLAREEYKQVREAEMLDSREAAEA